MKTISATELKANVSAVLGDVERGETVEITRHGKVVARMEPETVIDREEVQRAIDGLRKFRESLPKVEITIEEILEMRHAGTDIDVVRLGRIGDRIVDASR